MNFCGRNERLFVRLCRVVCWRDAGESQLFPHEGHYPSFALRGRGAGSGSAGARWGRRRLVWRRAGRAFLPRFTPCAPGVSVRRSSPLTGPSWADWRSRGSSAVGSLWGGIAGSRCSGRGWLCRSGAAVRCIPSCCNIVPLEAGIVVALQQSRLLKEDDVRLFLRQPFCEFGFPGVETVAVYLKDLY